MTKSKIIFWPILIIGLSLMAGCRSSEDSDGSGKSDVKYEGGTLNLSEKPKDQQPAQLAHALFAKSWRPYIVIDRYCNKVYLRTNDSVLFEAVCSVGSGAELVDSVTNRHWKFETPAGVFVVHTLMKNPWWRKPDWAFIEEGEPLPKEESERFDSNMMGDFAIGFGDGYFIHGTIYERLLGTSVTHGCVRLGSEELLTLYNKTQIGTKVYIY